MTQPRWQQNPPLLDVGSKTEPGAPRWQQNPPAEQESEWWGTRAAKGVASVARGAYDMAFPERDPDTAHIPGFASQGLNDVEDLSRIERSKFTAAGFEDKPWRRTIMETLGDRVLDVRADKFGNEIVKYRGDDGQEHETYINRPGLDMQDVSRTAHGAVPYFVGGGVATRALGGLGRSLAARLPAQAAAAGAVSIGQDVAAGEPASLGKAAITAAGGAAGEAVGTLAPKIWRSLMQPDLFDETANALTPAGRKVAERLGLEPDRIQGEVGRRLHEIRRASDPRAAAAGIEAGEFNIPTTLGQRTKDPEQLNIEEQMRRSLFGPGAREVISDFDVNQARAIHNAADEVRARVAPQGSGSLAEAGQGTSEALRSAQRTSRQTVEDAWDKVGEIYPVLTDTATGNSARGLMTQNLRQQFDDLGFFPDQQLTPTAHKMMEGLTNYSRAMPERMPYSILGDPAPRAPALDSMRRRLLKQYQAAAPGQDKAAARAIYSGFVDWIEDAAAQQKVRGPGMQFVGKQAAQPMENARKITRQQRALFEPRTMQGRLTPSGKILTEIAENADTPERVVQTLFGASTGTAPKAGTVGAVKRLKIALPAEKFDQVKAAYFMRMVTGADGKMLSPGRLDTSVAKTFANQRSVLDQLFDASEQEFIQRFQQAVSLTTYRPPNPSGSSYALEGIRRKRQQGALNYVLRRMGTRSTFQGKVWQGTMYHWLARTMPNVFNTQDAASRAMARRAIGQVMEIKPDSGQLMAAISAAYQNRSAARERDARAAAGSAVPLPPMNAMQQFQR